jgi:hypothetical protein
LFTRRKRFTCQRCGWTARRDWHEAMRPDWRKPETVELPPGPRALSDTDKEPKTDHNFLKFDL